MAWHSKQAAVLSLPHKSYQQSKKKPDRGATGLLCSSSSDDES
jgi:hypothetical protein